MTTHSRPSRRRKGSTTTLHAADPDTKPVIPRLPAGLDLSAGAKRRWREIWSDPLASQYAAIDQPAVERLVRLYSIADSETNTRNLIDVSRECRALESQLGASPRARAALKLEYERGEDAERKTRRRTNVEAVTEVNTGEVTDADRPNQAEMLAILKASEATA